MLGPEVGGIAKDIQQLLAHFFVELEADGDVLEHDDEARLWPGLVDAVSECIAQGIEAALEGAWQQQLLAERLQYVWLGGGLGQIGVEKVVLPVLGQRQQLGGVVGADGLHDVRRRGFLQARSQLQHLRRGGRGGRSCGVFFQGTHKGRHPLGWGLGGAGACAVPQVGLAQ